MPSRRHRLLQDRRVFDAEPFVGEARADDPEPANDMKI